MTSQEHIALLHDFVRDHFGLVHAQIVQVLASNGPLSLFDVAAQLRQRALNAVPQTSSAPGATQSQPVSASSATSQQSGGDTSDGAIKFAMAMLHHQHVVQFHDEMNKTYVLCVGYGLMRYLMPISLRMAHQRYGEAGVVVVSLVSDYGAIPYATLLQVAIQRRPALHNAIGAAIQQLCDDGIVVGSSGGGGDLLTMDGGEQQRLQKKIRRESVGGGGSAFDTNQTNAVCTLCLPAILHRVRTEAMLAFMTPRHDDAALLVLRGAMLLDTAFPKQPSKFEASGYPPRVDISNIISLVQVRHALDGGCREDALVPAITRLSSGVNPVLMRVHSSGEEVVRVRYDEIVRQQRMEVCEQVLFARYGVLGVRLMKLLLKHEAMEDRFLAEEAIATLPQVRETLCGMMRDGYVRQQEIPRALVVDRQPKQSIFLWVMPINQLLATVSVQLVKALRHARLRLHVEEQRMRAALPQSFDRGDDSGVSPTSATTPTNTSGALPLTASEAQAMKVGQHAARALKATIFALMEQVLVMDYYGDAR